MRDQSAQDQELPNRDLSSIASTIRAHTQSGDLRIARDLARTIEDHPTEDLAVLQAIGEAFEASFDFAAARKTTVRQLPFTKAGSQERLALERRVALLAELHEAAIALHYDPATLVVVPEYFVKSIRARGNRVHSVALTGNDRSSILLDFGIDGMVTARVFYELMSKLTKYFRGRCAHELVPCDIHSYFEQGAGALKANAGNMKAH